MSLASARARQSLADPVQNKAKGSDCEQAGGPASIGVAGAGSKVRSGMRRPIIKRLQQTAPCERDPALPTMQLQVGGEVGGALLGQLVFAQFVFSSSVTMH